IINDSAFRYKCYHYRSLKFPFVESILAVHVRFHVLHILVLVSFVHQIQIGIFIKVNKSSCEFF
ncbi:hypothetical protein PFISCL1PPCAC_25301, partial [Pristionchus fissidentatus]